MKTIVLLLTASLLLAGCPGPSQPPPEAQPLYNPNQTTTPDWVLRGAGAMNGDKGKVLYGVGSAPKMVDISMQRDRAINRGRAEILKIFNTYIAYMMKDYARSTTAGDMSKESYEADVLQVQKTISIGDINGAQIVDNWKDPADGTVYSLAVLDMGAIADILSNKGELDAKLRDYVRANAAKAFDDLESEEAKRGK
jgi:hypothetical protein